MIQSTLLTDRQTDRQTDENYNFIDVAKLVCSIFVVAIHIPVFGDIDNRVLKILNFGIKNYAARIAVPFFFITSGFLLFRKMSPDKINFDVIKKYVLKIFRLYVIWTIIYLPISSIITLFGIPDITVYGVIFNIAKYVRNFIFTGTYTQLWYLNAVIVAVLILSFFLYKKYRVKNILIIASFFYLFGLLGQTYFGLIAPLKYEIPLIWKMLKYIQKIIGTTRNGLFDGFLFVGIGMYAAFYKKSPGLKKSVRLFLLSMLFLLIETFVLKTAGWAKDYNMSLFLAPASAFFFFVCKSITLKNHPIYRFLRNMSSLVFYTHMWVRAVVCKLLKIIDENLVNVPLVTFSCTLVVTLICSAVIIKLSEKKAFALLKKLYL